MNLLSATAIAVAVSSQLQAPVESAARVAEQPRVGLEFQLDNGTGSPGEPIILRYRLRNDSTESITVDWKGEKVVIGDVKRQNIPPWLSVRVDDPQGKELPNKFYDLPTYRAEQASSLPPQSLQPGGSRDYAVVLSQWYHPRSPGSYTVHLKPNISFVTANGSHGDISDSRTIAVAVGISSSRKLQARAQSLSAQIQSENDIMKSYPLVLALFSMPDNVANIWRSTLQNRRFQYLNWALNILRFRDSAIAQSLAEEFSPRYRPGVRVEVENKGDGTP